jgi:hypothetical protein
VKRFFGVVTLLKAGIRSPAPKVLHIEDLGELPIKWQLQTPEDD